MTYNPAKHHRRSIRLPGYDYTTPGAYFVTACINGGNCVLGEVVDEVMVLSPWGKIVQAAWDVLPKHYPNVTLSAFCVMPNHVHGIVVLTELPADVTPYPLSEIVRAFKSYSARKINHIYRRPGISLWQKNYYEVIIRRQVEWDKIRAYIESNPSNWEKDKFYVRPNTDH